MLSCTSVSARHSIDTSTHPIRVRHPPSMSSSTWEQVLSENSAFSITPLALLVLVLLQFLIFIGGTTHSWWYEGYAVHRIEVRILHANHAFSSYLCSSGLPTHHFHLSLNLEDPSTRIGCLCLSLRTLILGTCSPGTHLLWCSAQSKQQGAFPQNNYRPQVNHLGSKPS